MARRRRYDNELLTDRSGVGYSQTALDALNAGKYDQLTGRDPKYRTSSEQVKQSKELPVLEGIKMQPTTSNDDWQSSFGSKSRRNVDTMGARQKYAERINYEPMGTVAHADENYVVNRDRYNKLMQNGRLANDIKTLAEVNYKNWDQDATIMPEFAEYYGAKAITGGLSKSQFINQLSKRYELTPQELEDMALTFHTDANKAEVENYGKQLKEFGEKHPVVGSLGSFVGTLGSGIEGAYNAGVGAITGDDRYLSNMFHTTKNSPREGVRKNIKTEGGNTAYDVAMGVGDFGTAVASGGLPFITGGNAANDIINDAVKQGKDVRRSSLYGGTLGTARGIVDALTMGAGSTAVNAGKNFFTKAAIAGGKAGALGLGEQAFNELADALIMGNEGTYAEDVAQYMRQGLSEEEAGKRAMGNIVLRGGESALTRAALGAGISLVGSAAQGFKQSLRDLAYRIKMDRYVVDPDDPIFNEPIIDLDDLNEYYTRNENVLEGQTIPRLTGLVENPAALPGGNLPALPDNIYPIQMPGTNGVINLPGESAPIQLPDLSAISTPIKYAAERAKDSVIRSKPVLPSMLKKGKASSNNSYKVGDKVTYGDNGFEGAGQLPAVVKEVAKDHIVLDVPGLSDHVWLDNDMMDMVRPIDVPTSTGASVPALEIEDSDFAKGVANAAPDNSFSRMTALLNQVQNKVPAETTNAPIPTLPQSTMNGGTTYPDGRKFVDPANENGIKDDIQKGKLTQLSHDTESILPRTPEANSLSLSSDLNISRSEENVNNEAQSYWLRVLGDDEYAIQESQKNGMSVDDYRRIAASNVPGAEVPPPSNVPPTNNVPPTGNPNNGENMRERGMSKHMRGEGKMSVDIPEEVKQDFIDDPDMYEQLSNKATSERALKIYNEHPEDREAIFRNMLTQFDPAALPLGNMIAKDYSAAGNHAMAAQIIRDMGERLTKAGQFSQASIINMLKSDPLTAQEYAQRSIDKLNAQGKKEFGKKWKDMSLTKEEMDAFNDIEPGDEEALANLYDQIGQRLGREYPATRLEQLLEGRKVAMLFNVRTISRNFFANPPTLGMRFIADKIEALGQNAVHLIDPTFEKTQSLRSGGIGRKIAKEFTETDKYKALVNGTDEKHTVPDLKSEIVHHKQMYKGTAAEKFIDDWAGDVFNRISDALYNSGKTNKNPHITTPLKEINSRLYGKDEVQSVLETIRNTTYKLLDVTDSPFVKENFVERLGSYLNAQGIKSIDDIPDDAIRVAWNEALKATYKDDSWMVKALKGIKGGMEKIPVIGKPLSQGLIPFVQAPGNIAARMVDYSPINLAKGMAQIVKGAKGKDHETIRKGIEAASKGLTGTGMALLGMALYKSGILTGDYSSDDKEKSFQQRNGFKPWSLNVDGKYFTFNWMQPWAQTLMSGIIAQQAIDNADDFDSDVLRHFGIEGSTAGKIIGAAYMSGKAAYNSWFDEAPLGDFADLFAGTVFNKDVAQNTVDVGKDFAGGMYPATLNALAKTVDITKRNTKDKSNQFSTFVNEQVAKIPFVSKTLPAKYDTWGEEIKNADSKAESAFQRFFYPGEYSSDSTDPLDVEIQRLFKETNDNRVFPFYAADKVGDKALNNKESSEYQKDMGQRSKAFAEALVNSDRYKEMDDDSRVDTLNQMYYVSKAITERDVFGKPLADSSPYKKYVQAWDEAGGGEKGIQAVVNYSETKAQMKQAGISSSSKLGKEVLAASQKGDTATVDKITETAKSIDDMGFTKVNPKETYVKAKSIDSSITPESFTKTYREIDGADGSEPNEGIKMDEVLAYANKNHLNEQQMNKTWSMFAPSGKQVPYVKKDGTWGKHSPKK